MELLSAIIKKLLCYKRERIVVKDVISGNLLRYDEFEYRVCLLQAILKKNSYSEIIVCAENSTNLLVLYFAAMVSNMVLIPIDPEKNSDEINRIKEIHTSAFFLSEEVLKEWCTVQGKINNISKIDWNSLDYNKLYLITYTSGSTGNPKGVMHTIKSLFLAAYEFGEIMHYSDKTIMGHCMPMTYMAGILNTIIMPFIFGGQIVLQPRFSVKNAGLFWGNVKNYNVNTLWLSPTMLRILNIMDKKAMMKDYFHEVEMTISIGTAPLDLVLRNNFEEKYNLRLYQSYGLSETLFLSTEIKEEKISKHTVGRILPGVNIKFSNEKEILINVPWMFLGYVNEKTADYFSDVYYQTGDLGKINEDNNLIINGRKKDLIVRGGYNINPRDIENWLVENLLITECVVVSVTVNGEEQICMAYVSECEYKLHDINIKLMAILGKHNRIDIIDRVLQLPKNLNGKVDRNVLKKEMEAKYDFKI